MKHKSAESSWLASSGQGQLRTLPLRFGSDVGLGASQLSAALEFSSEPLIIVDSFDFICFANSAASHILRVAPEHLQKTQLKDYLSRAGRRENVAQAALEQTEQGSRALALCLLDGRRVIATLMPLADRCGQATHVCIRLERGEPESAEAVLEVMGRLAGELAHDINNQLSAALNYVFILQRRIGQTEPLANHLKELQSAAWRAAALTKGLRVIARKRCAEPEALELNQVITRLEPLLRYLARDVRLELRLASELAAIQAPLANLEQLIVTAAVYAFARAEKGSVVRLETSANWRQQGAAPRPRFVCELVSGVAVTPARPRAGMPVVNASLHRMLKRCRARLRHDDRRLFIEFE